MRCTGRRLAALEPSPQIAKRLEEKKKRGVYLQTMVKRLSMPKKVHDSKYIVQGTPISFGEK